ncbi:MAG: hypothetical protein IRZ26_07065 [Clostridia bacterium]|nr:hypothetical protein [Clostridia bacterium]
MRTESRMRRLLEEELERTPVPPWLHDRLAGPWRGVRRPAGSRSHALLVTGLLLVLAAAAWMAALDRPGGGPAPAARKPSPSGVALSGLPAPLQLLHMLSARAGWGVAWFSPSDGPAVVPQPLHVLRTADGGRHWRDVGPRGAELGEGSAVGAAFLDARVAWIAVSGPAGAPGQMVVWSTGDGGRSWSASRLDGPGFAVGELRIGFAGARDGWLLAAGDPALGLQAKALYATSDGGRSWRPVARSGMAPGLLPEQGTLTGLTFLDGRRGWLGLLYRGSGTGRLPLFRTVDGGRTWQPQSLPLPASPEPLYGDVYPPAFQGASQGLLPVVLATPAGRQLLLYRTGDGGESWRPGSPAALRAAVPLVADAAGAGAFFAADREGLLLSLDAGGSWSVRPYPSRLRAAMAEGYTLRSLDFSSGGQGWLLLAGPGGGPEAAARELFHTSDGGRTWQLVGAYAAAP